MKSFFAALRAEICMYGAYDKGEQFETIFFGGGTPSLLDPEAIRELLSLLKETFTVDPGAEITMEANPGTVDLRKLTGYREAGVNRMSFGVQSFHDDDLRFLTRIHSSSQAEEAIRLAGDAGFDNINLDLIFALPNQTRERWSENLRRAVEFGTSHISAYSLIVERNTPLARMVESKQVAPLPVDDEADMYAFTMEYLRLAGFEHYEVSNYARAGYRSRHNCNYWNHANYLGFGPSAHSFWNNRRWWNIANIQSYVDKASSGVMPVVGEEFLTPEQLYDETIMLGLRSGGVDLDDVRKKFEVDLLGSQTSALKALVDEHLAVVVGSKLRLTEKGFLLCDEITQRLLAVPAVV